MRTLVLGASLKQERYSNRAIRMLREQKYEVVAHGLRAGNIGDVEILTSLDGISNIHTVTLYLGPQNQTEFIEFILHLNPKRVLFNPGTENPVFQEQLAANKIEFEEACTLVLLSLNKY